VIAKLTTASEILVIRSYGLDTTEISIMLLRKDYGFTVRNSIVRTAMRVSWCLTWRFLGCRGFAFITLGTVGPSGAPASGLSQ
ncbi:hypothetical protein Tco_1140258, partial [Tanacetum coccineum]